jgi:hypothetical protein
MQDGEWKNRPPNWRELEIPIDDVPTPKSIVPTTNRRETFRSERRPRAGRPRTRPVKVHPHAGRGSAWNRKDEISNERILELHAQGLSYEKIGAELGIHPSTAHKRLTAAGLPTKRPKKDE